MAFGESVEMDLGSEETRVPSSSGASASTAIGSDEDDQQFLLRAENLMSAFELINDTIERHKDLFTNILPNTREVHYNSILDFAERISRSARVPPGWKEGFPLGRSLPPAIPPHGMRLAKFAQYNKELEIKAKEAGLKLLVDPYDIDEYYAKQKAKLSNETEKTFPAGKVAQHSDIDHLRSVASRYRELLKKKKEAEAIAAAAAAEEQRKLLEDSLSSTPMEEGDSTTVVEFKEEQEPVLQVVEAKERQTTISFFGYGDDEEEEEEEV